MNDLLINNNAALAQEFSEFDEKHPDIWEAFVAITKDFLARGQRRYSADGILHIIRWQRRTSTEKLSLKINNNHAAFYARKWREHFPDADNFFALRTSKADFIGIQ
jgi:hypothetical protein